MPSLPATVAPFGAESVPAAAALPGSPKPIFALDGATVSFAGMRRPALANVSLHVARDEQVALIGPSGAGKSTLLGLLNGTLAPTSGTGRVLGEDLSRLGPGALRKIQRRVGTVYQQHRLVENLRVVHNV